MTDRLKELRQQNHDVWEQQKAILAAIKASAAEVDEDAIVKGVLEGIDAEKIAAAIPDNVAGDVVNKLAERLKGGK